MSKAQIVTERGEVTPFEPVGAIRVDRSFMAEAKARIEKAKANAGNVEKWTDTTAIYWEALKGEEKTMTYIGTKPMSKKDDDGKPVIDENGKPMIIWVPVFTDGNRAIIMAQVAAIEAAQTMVQGEVYRIFCAEAEKRKAKKFIFNRYDG